MRSHPEIFNGLDLEYIINGHRSSRRKIHVTGENIRNSKVYKHLVNMPDTGIGTTRFLNSDDMKKLVYESTMNVVASVVSDSDYVDTGDDVSVSSLLERELTREPVSAQRLESWMWEAVYWKPDWARPDKITSFLNQVVVKDETDNGTLLLTEQKRHQVG